jgi:DNA-binding response OmpR family regulator
MENRCALFQVKTVKRGAHMKRRILLVDDEVAVLLTLKAVLEISGFDVDTAASAREGKSRLHAREYDMVITDMRMESDSSGVEVIAAARAAACKPAIALLTAFPVNDENWQEGGADKLLVKPMQTRVLLQQIEQLFFSRDARHASGVDASTPVASPATVLANGNAASSKKTVAKKAATNKASATKSPASTAARKPAKKVAVPVKAAKKSTKSAAKKSAVKR